MNNEIHNYYEVVGAGKIEISKRATWSCGMKAGFAFGVEWGKHGFAGGVLSREDAIKLAEHILDAVERKDILRREKLKKIRNYHLDLKVSRL